MPSIAYSELIPVRMRPKFIVVRKSSQIVDDHIHIRFYSFEVLVALQLFRLNSIKSWLDGVVGHQIRNQQAKVYSKIHCDLWRNILLTSVIWRNVTRFGWLDIGPKKCLSWTYLGFLLSRMRSTIFTHILAKFRFVTIFVTIYGK